MSTLGLRLRHDAGEGFVALLFGVTGWAISAAAMTVALSLGTPVNALAVHTVLCPVAFAFVSLVYFRRPEPLQPLATALVFGATVVGLDLLVRAVFRESWTFRDVVLATGIPAYGAIAVTWLSGAAAHG